MRYFGAVARLQPLECIPVSAALHERLAKPCLSLGNGRAADLLMSYAILRERPPYDLKSEAVFETLAEWYVTTFLPANSVPADCLSPDLLAHFNTVLRDHAAPGVAVTRFTELLWRRAKAVERFDLANLLDALLFTLEAIATQLPTYRQYRPFFAAMIPPASAGLPTFLDACIAALVPAADAKPPFSAALAYRTDGHAAEVPSSATSESTRRDVLLIGHGGQGSGLSRNFRMIAAALAGPDIALTTLNYDSDQTSFGDQLQRWRNTCRSRPIVIAAINAHDVPALFIRDRHDILDDCRIAGFFLWETSQAPRVQHLGVALVDEVWAPTQYVAEVYAPLRETHVVGKGLFAPGEWQAPARSASPATIRFLTVFDFHSSIERKNPLASVLAFQKAFPGGEAVELIVKASNVNPQHPGNASRQWERLCAASATDRRIRIVTARYSEEEMRQLLRDTSCVVSLHRSEGFGYVLSDAMALGIPVLATNYSGNADFCDAETGYPVAFRFIPVRSHGAHWESEGTGPIGNPRARSGPTRTSTPLRFRCAGYTKTTRKPSPKRRWAGKPFLASIPPPPLPRRCAPGLLLCAIRGRRARDRHAQRPSTPSGAGALVGRVSTGIERCRSVGA
jgi:glycosyltransferase involved in cell wall biosynthesis